MYYNWPCSCTVQEAQNDKSNEVLDSTLSLTEIDSDSSAQTEKVQRLNAAGCS